MKNGLYVETTVKNLRQFNHLNKNSKYETHFIGWRISANGYRQRFYMDYIKETNISIGEPYNIYFNCRF